MPFARAVALEEKVSGPTSALLLPILDGLGDAQLAAGDRAAARERPNAGELSALRRQVREQNEQAARNAENEGRAAGRGHGGRSR